MRPARRMNPDLIILVKPGVGAADFGAVAQHLAKRRPVMEPPNILGDALPASPNVCAGKKGAIASETVIFPSAKLLLFGARGYNFNFAVGAGGRFDLDG